MMRCSAANHAHMTDSHDRSSSFRLGKLVREEQTPFAGKVFARDGDEVDMKLRDSLAGAF